MRIAHPSIKSYVLLALMVCFGAKLVFTGLFVCSSESRTSWNLFGESTALAKDEKEDPIEKDEKKKDNDSTKKKEKAPEITDIKHQIGALEDQLKKINDNIDTYSKSLPRKSNLSPETLEKKRLSLEKERKDLDLERQRLTALKGEIDDKIVELTKIQAAVRNDLDQKEIVQTNRIKHLIKVYTTMPPKKSAVLIEKLDMDIIMALFSKMKGEKVGEILPYVSADKAAQISERLAKLNL